MRVRWRADDRFDIQVRGHTITVDQPAEFGGGDVGPTPTELFVAGLASASVSTLADTSVGITSTRRA